MTKYQNDQLKHLKRVCKTCAEKGAKCRGCYQQKVRAIMGVK